SRGAAPVPATAAEPSVRCEEPRVNARTEGDTACEEEEHRVGPGVKRELGNAERALQEPTAAGLQAAHGGSRPLAAGAVPARSGPGRLRPSVLSGRFVGKI